MTTLFILISLPCGLGFCTHWEKLDEFKYRSQCERVAVELTLIKDKYKCIDTSVHMKDYN